MDILYKWKASKRNNLTVLMQCYILATWSDNRKSPIEQISEKQMWIPTPKSWLPDSRMRNLLLQHKSKLIKTMKVMGINFYKTFVTLWVKLKIILPGKSEQSWLLSTWSNTSRNNPGCYCHGMQSFGYLDGHQLPIKSRNDVPRKL